MQTDTVTGAAEQWTPEIDIAEILRNKPDNMLWKSMDWPRKVRHLVGGMYAVKRKALSLGEFMKLAARRHKAENETVVDRYRNFIYREMLGSPVVERIASGKSVFIFGKEFFPISNSVFDFFGLIDEVILSDQYHAEQFIKKDSVVIDVGANIGTFTVFAAHHAPEGRVYAFEPAKATFPLLKRNSSAYQNISCVNAGLGDAPGEKTILNMGAGATGNVIQDSPYYHNVEAAGGVLEPVTIMTLDRFVLENNISRVDFIKIDAEGYEKKVLQGAVETIEKYKPVIAMSAYHNPDDKTELPRLLKSISPRYVCKLYKDAEEDFVCYAE